MIQQVLKSRRNTVATLPSCSEVFNNPFFPNCDEDLTNFGQELLEALQSGMKSRQF
jgi:hypothetical protein